MTRLLALEWDEREARVAVATSKGGQAVIEQAFTVELHPTSAATAVADIGGKIGAALSARQVGRVESLVAVGRPSIELRHLSLPPAPEDELPEMVRFQAMREFNALGDDWPLDYLPVAGSGTESHSVLAAAISPDLVQPIMATCQAAGLKPERLVLRPCAAASLLKRLRPAATQQVRLLVELMFDEADLTVLSGDKVVFLRTTRLPSETSGHDHAKALLAEIRRTSVAVQNRFGSVRVEAIYLCGAGSEQSTLAAQIAQDLNIPTESFDPFAGMSLAAEVSQALPAHPGRFAPLLGMLLDEAAERRPAVDFLNPRRKPPPPSQRNRLTAIGGIAAAMALLAFIVGWWQLSRLDSQKSELTAQAAKWTADEKRALDVEKRVKDIDKWAGGEVVWLDELADLARKLPASKDTMLTKLQWNPRPKEGGGELSLQCLVRSTSATEGVEQAIRDDRHHVSVEGGHEDGTHKGYPWKFESRILIDPPAVAGVDRRAPTPPARGAAAPAASTPATQRATRPSSAEPAPEKEPAPTKEPATQPAPATEDEVGP